jgi:hypothetical protein
MLFPPVLKYHAYHAYHAYRPEAPGLPGFKRCFAKSPYIKSSYAGFMENIDLNPANPADRL